jgi:molybdopterin-guanine dinucleotide biosynthesis protein A
VKDEMSFGAVILAGGQSRRMGSDKANLKIGGSTFLDRILSDLQGFGEVMVSIADNDDRELTSFRTVADLYKNCGPMSGLYSALIACESDALLVVTCDLPLFRRDLGEYLVYQLDGHSDAVVPVTAGRIHPLCAVYRRSCAAVFEEHLEKKDLKMRNALDNLRTKYLEISDGEFAEMLNHNINTRADYESLGLEDKHS